MLSLIERYGYLIVFLGVMLEGIGIPLPGETVLITAGVLAHRGSLTLWETMVMGSLGAAMGGQAGYLIGRFGGRVRAAVGTVRLHYARSPGPR